MPITVREAVNSRTWNSDDSVTTRYIIRGTANDYLVRQALMAAIPVTYEGRRLEEKPSIDPDGVDEITGVGLWRAEATYKPPSKLDKPDLYPVGSLKLTFDTTGGTYHRTASLATVASYKGVTGDIPNFAGAIGVTKSGVEGVDVPMPVFNLKADKVWPLTALPDVDAIYRLTATVNSAAVTITDTATGMSFTFQPGELLFRGASAGEPTGEGGLPMTYAFEASPNATGLAVGRITDIAKAGWDHLWVYYQEEEIASPPSIIIRPYYAYVEKVIPDGDLRQLGIFT